MSRGLTKEEKKSLLPKDKSLSNEIERVLDRIVIPENFNDDDLDIIKERITSFLRGDLPRRLTEEEIEEIVDVIPLLPSPIKMISIENNKAIKNKLRGQLRKRKYLIKEGTIEWMKDTIYEIFLRSILEAGSSVGSTGGMSVAEKITQVMLDAIHASGGKSSKEVSFKLINALIDLEKPPDILGYTVHFMDKNLVYEEISILGDMLRGVSVQDLVSKTEILQEVPKEDQRWYRNHQIIQSKKIEVRYQFLRLYLDINKCILYKTLPEEIIEVIMKNTEDEDFESTVVCVGSPLSAGFIDIHGDPDYIEYSVSKFSNFGKKIGECKDIKPSEKGELLKEAQKSITELEINDMTGTFLKVILSDCLPDMMIKGIKGITDVYPNETVNMNDTYSQTKVYSELEIEIFSKPPYSLKLDDINRLWNIKVRKKAIYFEGIPIDKIRRMFTACSLKIIVDNFDETNMATVLLPKKRVEKYYTDDGNVEYIYEMRDGKYYDVRTNEVTDGNLYGPKKLINNIREFERKSLSKSILDMEGDPASEFRKNLPQFSELYRLLSYNSATVEGKDISKDLLSSRIIDKRHLFPENTRSMLELYGIESARFYLTKKYLSIQFIEKLNPINIFLLMDLQTSFGSLVPIRSTKIYKEGNSVLSAASFEKQSGVFKDAAAFGERDDITSVGSRIVTGIPCKNGTGSMKISYDEMYISNEDNRYIEEEVISLEPSLSSKKKEGRERKMENDDVIGPCLNSGYYVHTKDDSDSDADNPPLLSQVNKKPIVCMKEKLPSPPRTRAPESVSTRSKRKGTVFRGDRINISGMEDIGDMPEFDEDEFLD